MGLYHRQLSRTTLVNIHYSIHLNKTRGFYNKTIMQELNQSMISAYENDDPNETILKCILLINQFSPYIYCIFGTILNLFLIVSYRLKEQKELHKHHMPYFCFANQLNIFAFFFSNVIILDDQRLVEISSINCKLFTYLSHIFSTYTTWILANGTFVLKCHVNKQSIRLDLNRKFLLLMPILISLFYASDLFYLELIKVDENTTFCGVANSYTWLLVRDLIDFLVFNVITVSFISYNLCPLKTQDKIIPKLKIIIPLAHTLLNFPISIFVFYRDYQIGILSYNNKINEPDLSNYTVEFLFTLAHLLSQCDSIMVVMGHVFLFQHYRNVFNCVCCCKCLRCQFLEFSLKNTSAATGTKSRSSRTRRNSSNDVLSLDELRKLDLSK